MTTRFSGFIVTLAKDTREDDAECIITAMRLIKGVISVKPIESDIDLHIATERVKRDLFEKLYSILD